MNGPHRLRARERALAASLLVIIAVFAARLTQIQIVQHAQWSAMARAQSLLTKFQQPARGEIRDRSGRPLAVTLPLAYAVGYRPAFVLDFDELAGTLAAQLSKPRRELRDKLVSPGFAYLARRVDWQTKQTLETWRLGCFQFDEEPRRTYPSTSSAAVVVGFANVDGSGMEGIEASMNDELSGEGYRELCRVDALRKAVAPISPVPVEYRGADVTLTIDLQLQTIVEDRLREGLKDKTFERACAIMVDPRSGDIVALATLPSYDLNAPGDAPSQNRRCWPVTDVVEPGSTLKIVPISKALESGRLARDTRIFCENGSYPVRGAVIHDSHAHGSLTVEEVLALSSNIGAAKICQQFSPSEIYDKLRAFGFGNVTQIEIAGEQPGVVPSPSSWSGPTQATLAFGQGISCTPLQVVMAYSAVANGGVLMKPRLVHAVDFPSGTRHVYPSETIRRVLPERVAREATEMLVGAVEYGTGKSARVDGVRIAGKTGTAEKVDREHRKYFSDRYISSFVGFFPAENPRYVLLVMVDDPQGEYYGAAVAAPMFRAVVEELLLTRPRDFAAPAAPRQMALSNAPSPGDTDDLITYSTVHLAAVRPEANSSLSLVSDSLWVQVPALQGWPLRQAVQELSRRSLSFVLSGSRVVVEQFPPAGTVVPAGTTCELRGIAD
jgi:cell division protein FtsI (penicillin-binding protein 3)